MTTDHRAPGRVRSDDLPLVMIAPSLTNPRNTFDKSSLAELTESIREHGVLQPVMVRKWPESRPQKEGKRCDFELVVGERRLRAAHAAKLDSIPADIHELSDAEVLEIQVVENLQRVDLHPLEEAEGYRKLAAKGRQDVARIAERTGRSVKYVYDRMKLLSLTKEARKAFADGRFAAGHAIILARLKPDDQKRALQHGALYETQHLLWDPAGDGPPEEAVKPVSVRELQAWVDKHVRFETGDADPMLFPETAKTLTEAQETKTKVVSITHEYQVHPEARGEGRIYTTRSWKRADGKEGSKLCPRSVTGVLVAGPGRGEALDVCINKDHCNVHWKKEQQAKKKKPADATPAPNRYELEEKRREEVQARWKKATPAILQAVAEKVKKAPARADGLLGQILLGSVTPYSGARLTAKLVTRGKSAEDLVRHAAFIVLRREAGSWNAPSDFPKRAKAFGVDVKKILDEVAPKDRLPRASRQPGARAAREVLRRRKKAARKAAPKKRVAKKTSKAKRG